MDKFRSHSNWHTSVDLPYSTDSTVQPFTMMEARNNSPNMSVNKSNSLDMSAGDADAEQDAEKDAETEEDRLEKRLVARCQLSALLSGLLWGLFVQFTILETKLLRITFWDEHLVTKSKTSSLFGIFFTVFFTAGFTAYFTAIMVMACLRFFRKLVSINDSAALESFKKLLADRVSHKIYYFSLGTLLFWSGMWAVLLTQIECALAMLMIVLFWHRMEMAYIATNSNPPSSPPIDGGRNHDDYLG
jgi:hypothetical protein